MRRMAALIALAAVLAGCPARKKAEGTKPAGALQVHDVQVALLIPPKTMVPGLTPAAVEARVKKKIAASPALAMAASKGEGTYQLRVQLGVGSDPDHVAGGGMVLVCSAKGDSAVMGGYTLQATTAAPLTDLAGATIAGRAWEALDSVMGDVLYQASLVRATPEQLVKALAVKDVERLVAAVGVVANRKIKAAQGALVKLLHHKEQRISDRAVGALVALGDPSVVKHLTRLAKFSDTERMAKVLDAIGTLGGKEATQYLEFVATGHEDEDIRNMASEALQRMARAGKQKTRR